MNQRTYALILLKGRGIGDLELAHFEEHYSKGDCEAALHKLLKDPPLASEGVRVRFGGACVLMQGEWTGFYAP